MKKEVKLILLTLGLYALSGGFFYNFQELWMAENNLSLSTIGTVFSLCALLSVSTIFLCSNLIKQEKIKKFTCLLLLIKTIILFALFFLNSTGLNVLIKFLIMVDYVVDVEIYACIYPMITIITKSDKIYAARGLIYSVLYYLGVLLTSILLGKTIGFFEFNYNFYGLIGAIVILLAFIILCKTDLDKYYKSIEDDKIKSNDILNRLIKNLKGDKISINYILFLLTGEISYYCITGLMLSLLTTSLGLDPSNASNLILILGIVSVGVGAIILSKLTLKNNYINFSIKYIGRFITYLLAAILCSKSSYLLAVVFTKITSDSYSHITDAPYINRFDGDYQLAFCNLREMVKYLSRAIGTFICGLVMSSNVQYIFIVASIFIVLQIIFGYNAIRLKNKEDKMKVEV